MADLYLSDVSAYQPGIDWSAYRAGGRRAVIIKATEGTTYVSEEFVAQRDGAHGVGLDLVGIYHFARPGDVQAQVRHFLNAVGTLRPGEVPVLDAEVDGLSEAWCREWLSTVQASTGRQPLLYASWSYWGYMLGSMTDFPLWIAAYGPYDPRGEVPNCRLWQYTDSAPVPGIGECDDSLFVGSEADLLAMGGGDVVPPDDLAAAGRTVLAFVGE